MPDGATLALMYGTDYVLSGGPQAEDDNNKQPFRVVEWLKRTPPGVFLDYGCGAGELLVEAQKLGWTALGVELNRDVAQAVAARTGAQVVSDVTELDAVPCADVLHLGDVIEHLTGIEQQMPDILRLLKPGGLLLAQGPLEANANLFTLALKAARALRPQARTEMAPYHVLLATGEGQRTLFRRFGLAELEYSLSEVAWPAPASLPLSDLRRPRTVAMFGLRRASQAVSALRPHRWGNRYFYAGRKQN
jgi:SAM-dependent methyltransferase